MPESVIKDEAFGQDGDKVCVELAGSLNSCKKTQIKTAQALGLFRRGNKREHTVSPCLKGQVKKIEHLLKVTKVSK